MFYVNENMSDFLPFEYWQTAAAAELDVQAGGGMTNASERRVGCDVRLALPVSLSANSNCNCSSSSLACGFCGSGDPAKACGTREREGGE